MVNKILVIMCSLVLTMSMTFVAGCKGAVKSAVKSQVGKETARETLSEIAGAALDDGETKGKAKNDGRKKPSSKSGAIVAGVAAGGLATEAESAYKRNNLSHGEEVMHTLQPFHENITSKKIRQAYAYMSAKM